MMSVAEKFAMGRIELAKAVFSLVVEEVAKWRGGNVIAGI